MRHARKDYQDLKALDLKIPDNEPVFLLRAQDATAAETVRYWASMQSDAYLKEVAMRHATAMDKWPVKKDADCPDSEIPEEFQLHLPENPTENDPFDTLELLNSDDMLEDDDDDFEDEEPSDDVGELKENQDFAQDDTLEDNRNDIDDEDDKD